MNPFFTSFIRTLRFLLALGILLTTLSHQAAAAITKTWTGATSTNWATASNWSPSGVPGGSDEVEIPDVTNNPVILSGTVTIQFLFISNVSAHLTINAGATLNITGNTLGSGCISIKGTLTNNGTLTVGHSGITLAGITGNGGHLTNTGSFIGHVPVRILPGLPPSFTLTNTSTGTVDLDGGSFDANSQGALTLINSGIFKAGFIDLYPSSRITNNVCGKIILSDYFDHNGGTTSNAGLVQVANTLSGNFTNATNGVLVYGAYMGDGSSITFSNGSVRINNNPTNSTIFTYQGTFPGTIDGIFRDVNATLSAGTFTANTFAPSGLFNGSQTLYAKITPSGGACNYVVPFTYNYVPTPTITGFNTLDNTVCAGSLLTFTATVGDVTGAYDFTLTNGSSTTNGNTSTTAFSQTLTASGSGTQTFILTISDNGVSTTATTPVTVNMPAANILTPAPPTGTTLTCTTPTLTLTATGGVTYLWDNTTTSATRTISTSGTYSVTVSSADGCTAVDSQVINSNAGTITTTNPGTANATVGVGFTQTFTATTGAASHTFALSSGSLPTGLSLSSAGVLSGTPIQGGTFALVVRATDTNGCLDDGPTYTLTVNSVSVSGFDVSPDPICTGNKATFTATVSNVTGAYDFTLTNGTSTTTGTSSSLALSQTWTVSGSSTQTYTLTVANNGFSATATTTLSVSALPTANILPPPTGTTLTCTTPTLTLTATGGGMYRWDNNSASATRAVSTSGTYSVTVTSAIGCTSETSQLVISEVVLITTSSPTVTTAIVGVSFSQTFTATSTGTASRTFALASGTLPTGLTLASDGVLSGTPIQTGTFAITVRATDQNSCSGVSSTYSLTVNLPCGAVIHVTESGSGLQDGSSWTNSLPGTMLQAAITQAASCSAQVWVATGTYKPTTGTDRGISLSMRNNVAIYGGFAGVSSETALGNRPAVNPVTGQPSSSTLSGEIGNSASTADNSYHIVDNTGSLTNSAVLDGFVLTGGRATGTGNDDEGGAIFNFGGADPTIRNCLFINNAGTNGGAIANFSTNTNPVITNCVFRSNSATNGGGIHNSSTSNPTLTNCTFESNTATNGGAIYNTSSSPQFVNCSFLTNASVFGGGCYNTSASSPTLTNCSFQSNTASNATGGGVMYSAFAGSTGTLLNCVLWNNGGAKTLSLTIGGAHNVSYSLYESTVTNFNSVTGNLTTAVTPFASTTGTQLATSSAAINAGDPATTTATLGTGVDLGGNPRIVDDRVDMGAYETQSTPAAITITGFAASPNPVCAGATTTFTATVGNITPPYSFTLNNGSGNLTTGTATSTAFSQTVTISGSGTQTFTLDVAQGASFTTATTSVTVSTLPTATLTASRDAGLPSGTLTCAQTSLTLTATGGMSYTFAGPGVVSSNATAGTAVVNTAGTYTVTVANANGCTATSTTIISQNTTPPSATITTVSNLSVLDCNTTVLSLSASGGGTYSWDNSQTTVSRNVNAANTYSVTVTGGNGCTAIATKTISQNITPPPVSLTATDVCTGQSVTLTATSGISSYTFVGSSGVIGSGSTNFTTVSGLSAGPQSFTVRVTSSVNSCTNTATDNATVTALPTPTLTAGPSNTLTCAQTSLTLTATGGTSYTFVRTGGGGIISQDQNAGTAVVNQSGMYSVTAMNASGCTSVTSVSISSGTATVSVTLPSVNTATQNAAFSQTFTASGGVAPRLFALASGTLPTGLTLNTDGVLSGTPTQSGTFTVTVRATDQNSCSGVSSTYSLTVSLPCGVVIHVTESGSGLQDGSSWANSLPGTMLQAAITRAASCSAQVWVARGTYKPTSYTGVGSRNVPFQMLNNVAIYGGFVGTETSLTGVGGRIITMPSGTTLSGEIDNDNTNTNNSYHVVVGANLNNTARLDGVVITGGNADNNLSFGNLGGGIFLYQSISPILANCTLEINSAVFGGGISTYTSNPSLVNCVLQNNSATSGGGLSSYFGIGLTLTNCVLQNNSAASGGGLHSDSGRLLLTNCTVQSNSATAGGAIGITGTNFSLTLTNSIVWNNGASNSFSVASGTIVANYSLFEPSSITSAGVSSGPGNLTASVTPFASTTFVALNACTPAINAGNNSATGLVGITTDLIGNTRVFGGTVDMGAVEFQGSPASFTTTLTAGPSGTLTCAQTSLTLTATGGSSYTFSGPGVSQSGASQTAIVNQAGIYSVTAMNASGCTNVTSVSVSNGVNAPPVISLDVPAGFVCGTSVSLTATSGLSNYTFTGPGGLISAGAANTATASNLPGGPNTFTVVAEDATGCRNTATISLTLNQFPTVLQPVAQTVCAGATVSFTSSATGYPTPTAQWFIRANGNTTVSPVTSPTLTFVASLTDNGNTYRVNYTNGCGTVVGFNRQLTVIQPIGLTVSDLLSCTQTSVTLTATSGQTSYTFGNGATQQGGSAGNTATVSTSGVYGVTALSGEGCVSSATVLVQSDVNTPTVSIAPASATLTCAQPGLTLTATFSETALRWSTGATSTTLLISSAGTYAVTATAANGCTVVSNTVVVESNTALTGFGVTASASVCAGAGTPAGSVTLTASGCGGGTVNWPAGAGLPGITGNIFSTSISGTYTATCTVGACSTTASGTATIGAGVTATLSAVPNSTLTCAQSSLTLMASGGTSYTFTGPGVVSSDGTAGTAVVNAAGTYTVTVANANGCTATSTTVIGQSVGASTADLVASGTLTCAVTAVTLTASGGGTYAFIGTGIVASSGSSATVNQANTFSVVVTGSNGCTALATTTVGSNTTAPTPGLTSNFSGTLTCAQTSLTLTATGGTIGTPTGYTFAGPGVVSQNVSAGTAVVNTSGTYSVTVGAANGCSSVTTTTVSSNTAAPTVSIIPTSGTLTCAQTSLTLTATSSGTGLLWSNAATTTSITVNSMGTYSVTASAANGCSAVSNSVIISQNIAAPTASIMASGSLSCGNPTVTLTGSGGNSYLFSGAGASNLGLVSQSGNQAMVNQAGPYSLTVTNTATGCFSTTSITVTGSLAGVAPTPTLPASASAVCEGGNIRVAATVSGTATGYQWYRNGAAIGGQTSATLTLAGIQASQSGSYSLMVSSGCGSATSTAFTLTVNPLPTVSLIVPNNATVQGATITLPAPLTGVNFQVLGGVFFERMIIVDRINGYEIRQVDSNTNGVFPINRTGPFRLTVTGANGCQRTVEGVIQTQ